MEPSRVPAVVDDSDRHLGDVGVVGESHEAANRDQAAYRLSGGLNHQSHVIAAVHFREVTQLRPAEAALRREEAPVRASRLRGAGDRR